METGIIKGFSGNWNSGIGHLIIEDMESGHKSAVPCENGPTVRALQSAFGDVIGDAHDIKNGGGHINQKIEWDYDDMGLMLGWFAPVEMM
jgi:hypothetical protein